MKFGYLLKKIAIFYISIFAVSFAFANDDSLTLKKITCDYNIIFIIADCLRADHLSCYGYFRKTSPNIDDFARKSILFRQAISQAPTTLLSFSSFLTSQYVSTHGVKTFVRRLSDSMLTLPEILKIYNYKTAAFLGGPLLNPIYFLNQGFDTYDYSDRLDYSFKTSFDKALKWIEEKKEKFFILIHGNDLHTPYVFPLTSKYNKNYTGKLTKLPNTSRLYLSIYKQKILIEDLLPVVLNKEDMQYTIDRYDEGINHIDELFGIFLRKIKQLNLLDKTIIIFIADHGEGLFDHDYFFHEFNLYDNTIRVPLLIWIPNYKANVISSQVQLIDLMPTILELVNIPINDEAEGKSLVPLLTNKKSLELDKYILTESSFGGISIRTNRWKLIHSSKIYEFYDLKNDPNETKNLFSKNSKIAISLLNRVFNFKNRKIPPDGSKRVSGDVKTIQKIKSLKKDIERMRLFSH
jgi:arylsulfatase A-like enzyme